MPSNVFYSWQSDLANSVNRGLIRKALDDAILKINHDLDIDEPIRIDQDTQGVSGSPPIAETILKKIDECAVFIPDVSFVSGADETRQSPNPNVMIEYGYAVKSRGDERIVPVFNTAFGDWRELPFDMRHKRRPILYCASGELSTEDRRDVRSRLAKQFETALLTAQMNGLFDVPDRNVPVYQPIPAQSEYGGSFLAEGETLGIVRRSGVSQRDENLVLRDGPLLYMRLWQRSSRDVEFTNSDAISIVRDSGLRPMCSSGSGGWSHGRNRYGAFCFYTIEASRSEVIGMTQLFKSGELWGIDTYYLNIRERGKSSSQDRYIPTSAVEDDLVCTLESYLETARDHTRLVPPLELRVGATQVIDHRLAVDPTLYSNARMGKFFEHSFESACLIESYDQPAKEILKGFLELMFDQAGVTRIEPVN